MYTTYVFEVYLWECVLVIYIQAECVRVCVGLGFVGD